MEIALNYMEKYDYRIDKIPKIMVRSFLKWAGGKTQLIEEIEKNLPIELKYGDIKRYVEPFVGSGAVFFLFSFKI